MPDIDMVCLANSRKLSGRCIAGREIVGGNPGRWIRPISDREHGEVSECERRYEDGSDPRVLDVISISLTTARPVGCQTENWLFDSNVYWEKTGTIHPSQLNAFESQVSSLWGSTGSTYHGQNDQIPEDHAGTLPTSLALIQVPAVDIRVFAPQAAFGNDKRRVLAMFDFNGAGYALWVTDPRYERQFLAKSDGDYELGPSYLTISIGEPHEGYCYKLVAAIIEI